MDRGFLLVITVSLLLASWPMLARAGGGRIAPPMGAVPCAGEQPEDAGVAPFHNYGPVHLHNLTAQPLIVQWAEDDVIGVEAGHTENPLWGFCWPMTPDVRVQSVKVRAYEGVEVVPYRYVAGELRYCRIFRLADLEERGWHIDLRLDQLQCDS